MLNMGQSLKIATENLTGSQSDTPHVCSFCQQVVPKKAVTVYGATRFVQPYCKCEVQQWEQGINLAVDTKRGNEILQKFSVSNLGRRFQECRFSSFQLREGAEVAFQNAQEYAANFKLGDPKSLVIWGMNGCGKSHLAASVCHVVKDKGYTPIFQTVPELLEKIRDTFNGNNTAGEKGIMDALRDCDLLVLDDIGSEKISDWTLDVLFRVIDARYRDMKPTLFTTNFSPTQLLYRFMPDRPSQAEEIRALRIHDRILETSRFVENKANSFREKVAFEEMQAIKQGKQMGSNINLP